MEGGEIWMSGLCMQEQKQHLVELLIHSLCKLCSICYDFLIESSFI